MPYWFDGNNLIGRSVDQARSDPGARKGLLRRLSGWARSRGGRFVVFFDGDDPDRSVPPAGIQVRYSAPVAADENILRRLREIRLPSEVIVVTNDRRLAFQCREAGAVSMNWRDFCARMKKSSGPRRSACESDTVDLRDWADYFGLEDEDFEQ